MNLRIVKCALLSVTLITMLSCGGTQVNVPPAQNAVSPPVEQLPEPWGPAFNHEINITEGKGIVIVIESTDLLEFALFDSHTGG